MSRYLKYSKNFKLADGAVPLPKRKGSAAYAAAAQRALSPWGEGWGEGVLLWSDSTGFGIIPTVISFDSFSGGFQALADVIP